MATLRVLPMEMLPGREAMQAREVTMRAPCAIEGIHSALGILFRQYMSTLLPVSYAHSPPLRVQESM